MENLDAIKYPIVIGPKKQPDIRKSKVVIINNVKYKVLVDKDNPSFASVWTKIKGRWSKQPFRVYYHFLECGTSCITADNLTGKRDPIFTCDCHNHDKTYRPEGYCCEHILVAIMTVRMIPGDHTNKSFPTTKQMLES